MNVIRSSPDRLVVRIRCRRIFVLAGVAIPVGVVGEIGLNDLPLIVGCCLLGKKLTRRLVGED